LAKIRVSAPARIHMGILNPSHSIGRRRYGSVGVGIEEPRTVVDVEPADRLDVTGSSIAESKAFAGKTLEYYKLKGAKIDVLSLPQRHAGLGSTTQLSLSIATGITRAYGLDINPVELATVLERGKQSAIGTYVFQRGGFIIEGGWGEKTIFPPLLSHYAFPEDWRFLIIIPEKRGPDETQELEAFERLKTPREELVNEACYRLFLGMAPAVVERNIHAFGENLTRLQQIVGTMFSQAQGGVFQPESAPLIKKLEEIGAAGVGQSSWGPTVYSLFDSEKSKSVEDLLKKEILHTGFIESDGNIRGDSKWGKIHFTRADNKGALVTAFRP
jgi:beta-ribofuranosylaminobenzene 5'-phosphate synthase